MKENETLQAALDRVLLVKLDAEKEAGPELAEQYGVRGYPTFVVLNPDGQESDRWIGFNDAEEWAAVAEQARGDLRSIVAKRQAYEQEPTLPLAKSLARHAMATGENVAAVEFVRQVLRLNEDPAQELRYREALFEAMARTIPEGPFTVAEIEAEAQRIVSRPDVEAQDLLDVAYTMGRVARTAEDMTIYAPYLERAMTASEGVADDRVQRYRKYLQPDHALYVEKNEERAVALKKESEPEGWLEDPDQLNSFAWWCFENHVNLAEAEELALRGAELASDDGQRANILDTAAEICYVRGDRAKAVELIQRAVALDPAREHFQKQLERFTGAIAGES